VPIPRETRTPVKRWRRILQTTSNELFRLGANDVWVFGSQAMSLHMRNRALASKDLDLLATGVNLQMINQLCDSLARYSDGRRPDYALQMFAYEERPNPVFSISLVSTNERPFVVELFQTYLGYDVRRLTPYATQVNRWKNDYQTLSIEAIIGTRLAFRPPDRISPLNARRLNGFIRHVAGRFDWTGVEQFANDFQLGQKINENLRHLARRKLRINGSENLSFYPLKK